MSVTSEELDFFHRFAQQQLSNGGEEMSFDDCVQLWKQKQADDLAAIRQGITEADAGLGRPFEQVDAEICRKFGWQFDE